MGPNSLIVVPNGAWIRVTHKKIAVNIPDNQKKYNLDERGMNERSLIVNEFANARSQSK